MVPALVAIVDDDPLFTDYLKTLLQSRGYRVDTYTSGDDFLAALRDGAAPDVVLLDVMMPGMDGLETLRSIRAAHPYVQVIMLSGRQAPATIVDAVRLGAADYVLKPDDPDGLGEAAVEAAVRNAVERGVLHGQVARLKAQVSEDPEGAQPCWGPSRAMQHVMAMIERVADSDVGVLLRGESGVGKEVIAREIHRRSGRRAKPFVKVNCAALPSELLESELFGHERGAFTGAGATRVGRFEFANQGTLMLDEIGEMPAPLQAKLLHVLQDREFTRVGSNRPIHVDVRIVAASNRDLNAMMQTGTFREDLYYRLQVIEIHIPPLRERRDELPQLIEFFLHHYAERYGRPLRRPSQVLIQALLEHQWPGNVRELENVIKRFVVLQDEGFVLTELQRARAVTPLTPLHPEPAGAIAAEEVEPLEAAEVAAAVPAAAPDDLNGGEGVPLPELARRAAMRAERDAIQSTLDRYRWNRRKAAVHLGVSYKTLLKKIRECGIAGVEA
jgi:two-component system response regulator AtoC